jgi:hypothetical protein
VRVVELCAQRLARAGRLLGARREHDDRLAERLRALANRDERVDRERRRLVQIVEEESHRPVVGARALDERLGDALEDARPTVLNDGSVSELSRGERVLFDHRTRDRGASGDDARDLAERSETGRPGKRSLVHAPSPLARLGGHLLDRCGRARTRSVPPARPSSVLRRGEIWRMSASSSSRPTSRAGRRLGPFPDGVPRADRVQARSASTTALAPLRSIRRRLREHPDHELGDGLGDPGRELGKRARRLLEVHLRELVEALRLERALAGEEPVEEDAERVEIRLSVDGATRQLLRATRRRTCR